MHPENISLRKNVATLYIFFKYGFDALLCIVGMLEQSNSHAACIAQYFSDLRKRARAIISIVAIAPLKNIDAVIVSESFSLHNVIDLLIPGCDKRSPTDTCRKIAPCAHFSGMRIVHNKT